MGVALFGFIIMVCAIVQYSVFTSGVLSHSPDLAAEGFSMNLLSDPRMVERMTDLQSNGDLMARTSLWSGGVCSLLILLAVRLWKGRQAAAFLGIRAPQWRQGLIWLGAFVLLGFIIELLAHYVPAFRTDFMQKVTSTSTNMALLMVGVGLMAPLFEELLLRGLLFGSIRHVFDEHASVALTAGVFAVMHMQYNMAVMMLILPMGIVLGYARSRSGSIWVPVVIHAVNNMLTVVWP